MANGAKGGDRHLTVASVPSTVGRRGRAQVQHTQRRGTHCLVIEEFGERKFRDPQEFRYWFDGQAWQVRGPFGIDFFSDARQEVEDDVRDCLYMLWDVYVCQDPSLLTGDAARLRDELLSAVE